MIALRLPWPPSINHYWRHTKNGTYISAEGQAFRADVEAIVADELGMPPRLKGRLGISIELTIPNRLRRDIDNHVKCILDALESAGVFLNDSQVDELRIKRLHVEPPGAADVIIQEL